MFVTNTLNYILNNCLVLFIIIVLYKLYKKNKKNIIENFNEQKNIYKKFKSNLLKLIPTLNLYINILKNEQLSKKKVNQICKKSQARSFLTFKSFEKLNEIPPMSLDNEIQGDMSLLNIPYIKQQIEKKLKTINTYCSKMSDFKSKSKPKPKPKLIDQYKPKPIPIHIPTKYNDD